MTPEEREAAYKRLAEIDRRIAAIDSNPRPLPAESQEREELFRERVALAAALLG